MANHTATKQMLGYLYQIECSLLLLLQDPDENTQICVEKLDDITIRHDTSSILVQMKHHTRSINVDDSGEDMWRTLHSWIDMISNNPSLLDHTKFVMITTATAKADSIAHCLTGKLIDANGVYERLITICNNSQNLKNKEHYKSFKDLDKEFAIRLLRNITIIDNSFKINEIDKAYSQYLKYSCLPKHEILVREELKGWWYTKVLESLCSPDLVFISQGQLRSKIIDISDKYKIDDLPISIQDPDEKDIDDNTYANHIFHKQLMLIALGERSVYRALKDYFKASTQRSKWIKDDVLYLDDLSNYDIRIIEEWEYCFAKIYDDISICSQVDSNIIEEKGRDLYYTMMEKDIRIRERCSEPFVMRGTCHILADLLKIGWHIDYHNILSAD